MKKTRRKRYRETLFTLWLLSNILLLILFLFYWISVNKLIILIVISAAIYYILKRFNKRYLTSFYLTAISINILYGLIKLL